METNMKTETQLVAVHGSKATTTSLIVAQRFGKRHDTVLRAIRNIECSDKFRLLNFAEISVEDSYGRKQPAFQITRDGFSFLAMGFTGKKAAQFKEDFINAFNMMEQALLNQQNLSWKESRANGKIARHSETDTINKFVQYAVEQGSQNATKYFMNLTTMTYRSLFYLKEASPKPFRDLLDSMQLMFLATAEGVVEAAIQEGMQKRMFYKDIYKLARDRVTSLATQLPLHRLEVKPSQSLLFA